MARLIVSFVDAAVAGLESITSQRATPGRKFDRHGCDARRDVARAPDAPLDRGGALT